MDTCVIDLESFWDTNHSLSKMSPIEYVMHPETEIISAAIKVNDAKTAVVFGEDEVCKYLSLMDFSNTLVIGHNMAFFDAMLLRWRLGVNPKMWGCTLAMARPMHAKTTGLSLAKLVTHYNLGVKDNSALLQTKGRHLCDFTPAEITAMRTYNRADTDQCYALFNTLKKQFSARELWQIDATIRMLVDPKFEVDVPMLEAALCIERDQKRKHILMVAKKMRTIPDFEASAAVMGAQSIDALEEAVRAELASAPKFAALLGACGVEVPMKVSPSNPDKMVPALAKTDEEFTNLQEHDDPLVAAATRARLAVKSTLLETRIEKFIATAEVMGGKLPVPISYCGADTTGRDSGSLYNVQNLPRVTPGKPKVSDALRNCIRAPRGYKVIVSDLSGIEMRVNMFLWKVPYAMALFQADPAKADLYKSLASEVLGVEYEKLEKSHRQAGKAMHLGCGFGLGSAVKYQAVAKTMAQIEVTEDEAAMHIAGYREKHPEIVKGWKLGGIALGSVFNAQTAQVDPWRLITTTSEGLRLPSGRLIRYPNLRIEDDGQWPDGRPKRSYLYAQGRHKARISGPKVVENIVQALARDIIFDDALLFFKSTGLRPQLRVHDELVYVVPDSEAQPMLDELQRIMRTPPKWWPELVVYSEGDIAQTYGAAK